MKRIISVLFACFCVAVSPTRASAVCTANQIDVLGDGTQCETSKFSITTTNDTTRFQFVIRAAGTFYVDWGDGSAVQVLSYADAGNGTEITHTFPSSNSYTIRFGGLGTSYPSCGGDQSTLDFTNNGWYQTKVASVSGSLSALFPQYGTASGEYPCFIQQFSGCTNLTSIPSTLFSGITGGIGSMFYFAFGNCTKLTTIPDGLFDSVVNSATSQFALAFKGCTQLNNIPDGLFANITTPAQNLFNETFRNCTALTTLPENMFSGITTAQASTFSNVFNGCTNLSGEIPLSTFSGLLDNGQPYVNGMFNNTFIGTALNTTCAANEVTYAAYTPYWNDKVTCRAACPAGKIASGVSDCEDEKFSITTTSDTTSLSFALAAVGNFYVDWGDGSVQTIKRTGTSSTTYSHTYAVAGVYTVRFGGLATSYHTGDTNAAISFSKGTQANIASMTGSLGAIFPQTSATSGQFPRFYQTFYGATSLTSIPSTLFNGLTTAGTYMFDGTFQGCTGLTSIPSDLFCSTTNANNCITGGASYMFRNTFNGCTGLTELPENLFSGVNAGTNSMFDSTFANCSSLEEIPAGLFSGITNAAEGLFLNTFVACTKLGTGSVSYIPPSTFSGLINNDSPTATNMWTNTFGDTALVTACPGNMAQYITGYEGSVDNSWNGKVSCQPCPAGYDYNTTPGKQSINECQIHCDAGTYVKTALVPLPLEYTRLLYLESTGTQYINTGYSYADSMTARVVIDIEFPDLTQQKYSHGASRLAVGVQKELAELKAYFGWWTASFHKRYDAVADIRYLFDLDRPNHTYIVQDVDNEIVLDDVDDTSKYDRDYSSATGNFYLFANGTAANARNASKIYSVKLYDDGVLVRDMLPVRRNSDGVLGMYDMVTGTFYTNAGTGTFVAGELAPGSDGMCENVRPGHWAAASTTNFGSTGTRNDCGLGTYSSIENGASAAACIPCAGATYGDATAMAACKPCPTGYTYDTTAGKTSVNQCQIRCAAGTYIPGTSSADYTRLDYLEGTGTQYIQTDFYHSSPNIRGVVQVGVSETVPDSFNQDIMGNVGYNAGYSVGWAKAFKVWVASSGNRLNLTDRPLTAGTMHTFTYELTEDERRLIYGDETTFSSHGGSIIGPQNSPSPNNKIGLFFNGQVENNLYTFQGRIYRVTLYEDDVLVHDFVPVRRNRDGVLGMYDEVTDRFFTNSGTGEFIGVMPGQCIDVGTGYYSNAAVVNYGNNTPRTACPVGTYSDITNGASCKPCTTGTYNNITAAAACKPCPTGYTYDTTAGKTSVNQCQIRCAAGTYETGYTRLEYLESTGEEYINTGSKFLYGDEFFFDYMPIARDFGEDIGYGAAYEQTGDYSNNIVGGGRRNGNYVSMKILRTNINYSPALLYNDTLGKRYTEHWTLNSSVLNSVLTDITTGDTYTVSKDGFDVSYNSVGTISLWTEHYLSQGYGRPSKMRIYGTWLKRENGEYAFKLWPARRNSDGMLGMYDDVTGIFLTNLGTGAFIAGNDIDDGRCENVGTGHWAGDSILNYGQLGTRNDCPVGTYSDIETGASSDACKPCTGATYNDVIAAAACKFCPSGYNYNTELNKTNINQCQIHCNGGTYVDEVPVPLPFGYTRLEYIESTGTQYFETGYIPQTDTVSGTLLVEPTQVKHFDFISSGAFSVGYSPNGSFFLWTLAKGELSNTTACTAGTKYDIGYILSPDTRILTLNGTTVSDNKGGAVPSAIKMFENSAETNFTGKMYHATFRDGDDLIFDFIPARRESDGAIGMYDIVRHLFFTGRSDDPFVGGPEITNGVICSNVGSGYWVGPSTINYGSIGTRNDCPAPFTMSIEPADDPKYCYGTCGMEPHAIEMNGKDYNNAGDIQDTCEIVKCELGYKLASNVVNGWNVGKCVECTAGHYCDGINEISCSTATDGVYESSSPGARDATECYKDCTVPCDAPVPCAKENTSSCQYNTSGNSVTGKEYNNGSGLCDIGNQQTLTCEISSYVCAKDYYDTGTACAHCSNVTFEKTGEDSSDSELCPDGTAQMAGVLDGTSQSYTQTCYRSGTTGDVGAESPAGCVGEQNCGEKHYGQCRPLSCMAGYYHNPILNVCMKCSDLGDGNWNQSDNNSDEPGDCYRQCTPYEQDGCILTPSPDKAYWPNNCEYTALVNGNPAKLVDGVCVEMLCNPSYEMIDGKCSPCAREHALTYKDTGNCIVATCDIGYHPNADQCEPDVMDCTPRAPHSTRATQTWNTDHNAFDICIIESCEEDYHIASNACVPDDQACEIKNGIGIKTWNTTTNDWDPCIATECIPGYTNDPAEKNNASEQCSECRNKFSSLNEVAVSSWITGCEIASCMYQGEKYKLKNNECVPICDQSDSDGTGSLHWNDATKKCERICEQGYMPW